MKTYTVLIKEIVVGEFEIEANSREEAIENGIFEYCNGNFVLEPGEVINRQISLTNSNKWEIF